MRAALGPQTAVWDAFNGQLVERNAFFQVLVVNAAIDLDTTFQIRVAQNLKVVRGWE